MPLCDSFYNNAQHVHVCLFVFNNGEEQSIFNAGLLLGDSVLLVDPYNHTGLVPGTLYLLNPF